MPHALHGAFFLKAKFYVKHLIKHHWGILALGTLAVTLVYGPGLAGGFFLDDLQQLIYNAHFQDLTFNFQSIKRAVFTSESGPLGRPVAMASFVANALTTGMQPFYFKLGNLLIHLLNGLLVFLIARRVFARIDRATSPVATLQPQQLAALVAVAWLLHPIHVSTVLYVVQRMTLLASLFSFAAIFCYLQGRELLE